MDGRDKGEDRKRGKRSGKGEIGNPPDVRVCSGMLLVAQDSVLSSYEQMKQGS